MNSEIRIVFILYYLGLKHSGSSLSHVQNAQAILSAGCACNFFAGSVQHFAAVSSTVCLFSVNKAVFE